MTKSKVEFPEWKGYEPITKSRIRYIKTLCNNDIDSIVDMLYLSYTREMYFYEMLLYIQDRLDRHLFNDEPIGLCLDSSKDIFDIMIVPCKDKGENTEELIRMNDKEDKIEHASEEACEKCVYWDNDEKVCYLAGELVGVRGASYPNCCILSSRHYCEYENE